ncbi:MAG: NAD(P)/FAD-dependent oxidoreductase [Candidatus Delongbacteria bacterium]|nr:NAD(P)/FAD-dependent oxidoreductase [Candidatus Delongbacteria bacterium]MBN2834353.1 NAD(P)/FAD-dependent oxidoreductase [Candidatus Delongbacteria bacterium]
MENYDIAVIGCGPAGFAAAMRGIDYGKKVCLIEAGEIGGAGLMHGALTSKTMWELSKDYNTASRIDRGYRSSGLVVDFNEVKKKVINAAKIKQHQILSQIETFAKEKHKKGSVTLIRGRAKILDSNTIDITGAEVKSIKCNNIVIATGSRPRPLTGYAVDQKKILDSDSVLNLTKFPEKMLIIGSGIIGCEYATIFSNFKQTEVHLLDRSHRVIPYEDDDVSSFVSENLEDNGVIVHHTANLRDIRDKGEYLEVVLDYEDGHSQVLEVDVALIAVGRMPNVEGLGLENLGIDVDNRGFLNINDVCMLTNQKSCNIFAAGDITGNSALVSVAELEGRYAVQAIFDDNPTPIDYSNMSTIMFFRPAVAAVGMNEKMLKRHKIPYKAAFYHNNLVNRAIAMNNTTGFVKIMISDDGNDKILGMRAAGPQASAFIVSVAHLINQGNSLNEIMKTKYPHPSITEGFQDCMRLFKGTSIFKPEAFPEYIKLTSWRPENS